VLVLSSDSSLAQIAVIVLGAVAGLIFCRTAAPISIVPMPMPVSRGVGIAALSMFTVLLVGLPVVKRFGSHPDLALFDDFYRSGALVFGGGHVVLPLLRDAFVSPGLVTDNAFLAGYGAAQAVPGPLFTFAAYLGAVAGPAPLGVAGAALGLIGIFLPGILVLVGTMPFWSTLRSRSAAPAAMRGINAAVVGLLGAALYSPIWTSSINSIANLSVALVCFVLLTAWHARPLWVVITGALAGIVLE
jgi:chromate transporter